MSDDSKAKQGKITPNDVSLGHLVVLAALVDELKASMAIDVERFAARLDKYRSAATTPGAMKVVDFFKLTALRKDESGE